MITIVGGGLSGLSLAYALAQKKIPYLLLEQDTRAGGLVRSEQQGPYLLEKGPNSLLADADMLAFIESLGLVPQPANPISKQRFIFRRGRYRVLPADPINLLLGSFFSWSSKRAILREHTVRSRSEEGETLGAFVERRLSKELVDYALDPFVSGIYAGDPYALLVRSTFPQLIELEARYGSVVRGLGKQPARRRQTISFPKGLQTLTDTLASRVHHLHLNTPVHSLRKQGEGFVVSTGTGEVSCQALVLTCEASTCAQLLHPLYPKLATALQAIAYPPMAAVYTAFKKKALSRPLNGFGGLNPQVEGRFSLGSIWSSSVFEGRCPPDEVLLTTFVGGVQQSAHTQLGDAQLMEAVSADLQQSLQLSAEPVWQQLMRWPRALPQYTAQALPAQQLATALEAENLFCLSNWKDGVSLSDRIRHALALADQLAQHPSFNQSV